MCAVLAITVQKGHEAIREHPEEDYNKVRGLCKERFLGFLGTEQRRLRKGLMAAYNSSQSVEGQH